MDPQAQGGGDRRSILHLDMDAFFVNVHILSHPEDAGRPLVVGGSPDGRGVVAAASYEARAFGVHSAMPSRRALKLCPTLKFVGHDWSHIKNCSRQVRDILRTFGPIEPMSVDEAYVDLSGSDDARVLAAEIQREVRLLTSLPCSVGLATSKLVAKVASDYGKPEGRIVVAAGDEARFLAPLSVRSLHGVGPVTEAALAEIDIATCGELAAVAPTRLAGVVGKNADTLIKMAKGIDPRPVIADRGRAKSVSSETTFERDVGTPESLEECVTALAEGVAAGLRNQQCIAATVGVKFREADFTTYTRQSALPSPTDSAADLAVAARSLFRAHWSGKKLRLLGVAALNLSAPLERQLSFLQPTPTDG